MLAVSYGLTIDDWDVEVPLDDGAQVKTAC